MAFLRDLQVKCLDTNGHIYDVYSLTCIYFYHDLLEVEEKENLILSFSLYFGS
jgi:hypothetical protein